MAHAIFRTGTATTNGKIAELVVDGVDITDHVLADGFKIEGTGPTEYDQYAVHLRLAVDVLEVELPEAVVIAATEDSAEDVA